MAAVDVHHRARLAQVLVAHQARHLVVQAEHLVHQGLVHQGIALVVRLVLAVLVRVRHRVHVALVTLRVLVAQVLHLRALALEAQAVTVVRR